jgi:hypothetical protein
VKVEVFLKMILPVGPGMGSRHLAPDMGYFKPYQPPVQLPAITYGTGPGVAGSAVKEQHNPCIFIAFSLVPYRIGSPQVFIFIQWTQSTRDMPFPSMVGDFKDA